MNLIQIQERLKDLPSSPQTMQALMAYANGASPAVPPYLALGELNRRKQMMEKAQMQQQAQGAPQGTVKDQVAQSAGIMALQQGRQQQGLQQMAQGMGQQMGQVPSQVAQAGPVQMARGGIVAFANGTEVEDIRRMADQEDANYRLQSGQGGNQDLITEVVRRATAEPPKRELPSEVKARLMRERPELFGVLNTPIGQTAMKQLEMVQEAQRAELAKQREEAAQSRPGILQLLGQAAAGTRGRSGRDALAAILGGYSDLSSKADAEERKNAQALRQKELEMMQAKADMMVKVEDLQRARAEGDIKAEADAIKEIADDAAKRGLDVAKVLREAGATQAQIENWRVTAAGEAEQRAETRRSNLAREGLDRQRLAVDRERLNRDKQEALRLRVEQQLASEGMFKNAMMMSAMLEMKPKRTPEEDAQLQGYRNYMENRRSEVERSVYGAKAAPAGAPKATAPTQVLRFDAQGRPIK